MEGSYMKRRIGLMTALALTLFGLTSHLMASTSLEKATDNVLLGSVITVDATPPIGTPLAGYGSPNRRTFPWNIDFYHPNSKFFKPSRGVADPIQSKVFLLDNGKSKLVFISLDIIGVNNLLYETITKELELKGYKKENIFISATHTHSGPGGLSKSAIWELIATDKFNPKTFKFFTTKIMNSIVAAEKELKPIKLLTSSMHLDGYQNNRMSIKDRKDVDSSLNVLLAKDMNGNFLGGLLNYAIHGTALSSRYLLLSGDIPAAMASEYEKVLWAKNKFLTERPSILYINSAQGDVSPQLLDNKSIKQTASHFAKDASILLDSLEDVEGKWKSHLSEVYSGNAKLSAKPCMENKKGFINKLLSKLSLKLKSLPNKLLVNTLQIGDMALMSFPGEATTDIGRMMKSLALKAGAKKAWVLGLTNGHYAYFTTPSEYEFPEYESCMSLFGKYGGSRLADGHWPALSSSF
jgi:hypothetical protein